MAHRKGWTRMESQACSGCGLHVAGAWMSRHMDAGCEARLAVVKDLEYNKTQRAPKSDWWEAGCLTGYGHWNRR